MLFTWPLIPCAGTSEAANILAVSVELHDWRRNARCCATRHRTGTMQHPQMVLLVHGNGHDLSRDKVGGHFEPLRVELE